MKKKITETRVIEFETAKLAKELGFRGLTTYFFLETGGIYKYCEEESGYIEGYHFEVGDLMQDWNNGWKTDKDGDRAVGTKDTKYLESFSSPIKYDLEEWIRETLDLDISIIPEYDKIGNKLGYIYRINYKESPTKYSFTPRPYLDSLERAMRRSLRLLLKLKKDE